MHNVQLEPKEYLGSESDTDSEDEPDAPQEGGGAGTPATGSPTGPAEQGDQVTGADAGMADDAAANGEEVLQPCPFFIARVSSVWQQILAFECCFA